MKRAQLVAAGLFFAVWLQLTVGKTEAKPSFTVGFNSFI
jgi:hypothetical protein